MEETNKPGQASAGVKDDSRSERLPLPEDALILLPTRNAVLFPGVILPLSIERPASIAAAQEAARSERPLGIVLQKDPDALRQGGMRVLRPTARGLEETDFSSVPWRLVTPEDVVALRKAHADRKQPWTAAELRAATKER